MTTEAPFEMANLFPKHTGLPFVVWISYRGGARHDVRVKVSPGPKAQPEEMASVALRPKPHIVEGEMSKRDFWLLTMWLELNQAPLIQYWEGEIDTADVLELLISIVAVED